VEQVDADCDSGVRGFVGVPGVVRKCYSLCFARRRATAVVMYGASL
jgi:hypothetical protein